MDRHGVRGASGGADPARAQARGEILRGVGAEVAVEGRVDGSDEGKSDERGARGGVLGDGGGEDGARGSACGEQGAAGVGGVREEGFRGGPGEVREVRGGDEARGIDPGRQGVGPDPGAPGVAGDVPEDDVVARASGSGRSEGGRRAVGREKRGGMGVLNVEMSVHLNPIPAHQNTRRRGCVEARGRC